MLLMPHRCACFGVFLLLVPSLLHAAAASSCSQQQAQAAQQALLAAQAALEHGAVIEGRLALVGLVDRWPWAAVAPRALRLGCELERRAGGSMHELDFVMGVISRLAWLAEPGAGSAAGCRVAGGRALLAQALVRAGSLRLGVRHDAAGALRLLQRAEQVARGSSWEDDALLWQGRALRSLRRREEALAALQRAAAISGSDMGDWARLEVAELLAQQDRHFEARRALLALLRRQPAAAVATAARRCLASPVASARRPSQERAADAWAPRSRDGASF